ncbi:MAG: TetR/AcrR family transcriptional regulator C-terminal domain-containing protein [Lachnospiraceae bacterium]|nr:TetR/AcrR family transcriptional regulator C-terminal domain-containing protein [Lachnospiraceae bacterium]
MKRKTTKDILADSFRELAEHKTIDKISVKEIVQNCEYSTATFYRHFKDKYDLIVWDYTQSHRAIMDRLQEDGYRWRRTLLDSAAYFEEHKEYLTNLLLHTNGYDSFVRNMTEIHYDSFRRWLLQSAGVDTLDVKTRMYMRLYCHGAIGLTSEWILGKYEASPEELAEIYEKSLPSPLRQYIDKYDTTS